MSDHVHLNSNGRVVRGKPDTDARPNQGDFVRVGPHKGHVVDNSPSWSHYDDYTATTDDVVIHIWVEEDNRPAK